ncbi:peptide ABC transporter substrate-binding protein [Paenibacillus sp. N1-5-1-14]|uniref:peptide ABC transporter substrate-binding protein n=1 Tax=Paenibacillus radicibacter TaxID=2972488 RepID=UPI0021597147|nr:peptide ABC transporter substrate-binding protein [Paenibacillus radicibacter]MCR8644776.1 peptide ABC transporter substrate-binding protein [Paenibacillus radicibacter]
MKKRGSLSISLLLAFSLVFTACSGGAKTATSSNEPSPTPGAATTAPKEPSTEPQILNLSAGQDIVTLNTLGNVDNPATVVQNNLLEGLYRLDPKNLPTPGIAKSHDVSADGKTYTFHLRDAKYSNGDSIVAGDFEYAWKKALDPAATSPNYIFLLDVKNAVDIKDKKKAPSELGIKAIDDKTLQVELANATPYFLSLITHPLFYPMNKKFVEAQGTAYAQEANTMIYSGPFVLDSWKHDDGYVFKKNPNYWDAANVKLEQINFKIVKDNQTAINLYEAGQIDISGLTSEFTEQYKTSKEYQTYSDPTITFLKVNQKNKYLNNVNIRKALRSSVNKEELTGIILNNGSTPANYLVAKDFSFGPDGKDFRDKYGDFQKEGVAEAKKYWEQGLKELGESAIKLEFLNYEGEVSKTIGQYLKNQWEKNLPGLTITINVQPQKQKLALEKKLQYDINNSGWGPDYQDPTTYLDIFLSDNSYNASDYKSAKYDDLMKKAKENSTNLPERWKLLQDAEKVLIEEDAAVLPLYQSGVAKLTKSYVKNVINHPFGVYTSYKWASIEGKKAK